MKKYSRYIAIGITALIMILLFPAKGQFKYKYRIGNPWVYETLISPIDFPLLKTDDEVFREMEAKASEVLDCYLYDQRVSDSRIADMNAAAADGKMDATFSSTAVASLKSIYRCGVVATFHTVSGSDQVVLVKKDKRIVETPSQNIYTQQAAQEAVMADLAQKFPREKLDSLCLAYDLASYIVPNLTYDEVSTSQFHKQAVNYVSPTKGTIYAGQLIVSKGELVTADIKQMLDSYKDEYERSFGMEGSTVTELLGHILIVAVLLTIFVLAIFLFDRRILNDMRKLVFLLSMVLIAFAVTAIVARAGRNWLFIVPYVVLLIYMDAFFDRKLCMTVYIVSLLPLLILSEYGPQLFITQIIAGAAALLSFKRFNRGWKIFINSGVIFAAMCLVYLAFALATAGGSEVFRKLHILFFAASSVGVVIFQPFVYLFEKIFGFVSYSRLWEMTDTNNKLLLNLSHKAPGTFQHSLQVANLAEAAVREIGGHSMLVRVGALYHDIGKMDNPLCFVENQTPGANDYHKDLSPEASAHDILRHVDDGVAMARKESIPSLVVDFIASHHGRTMARYFYTQYCNEGGDPANTAPFTYNGILPQTKEQAVLMIADSVEAASRTLKNYNADTISDLVEKIVDGKMSEHQFDEADISLKEIGVVKETLKTYLQQIYHARISYPARKRQ